MLGDLLTTPPYFLRQCLSLNPELTSELAWPPAGSRDPSPSSLLEVRAQMCVIVPGFYVATGIRIQGFRLAEKASLSRKPSS